jgi:soluble lytic murein transglycosylase
MRLFLSLRLGILVAVLLVLCSALAGCADAPPTPKVVPPAAMVVAPASTALPTPTSTRTLTPMPTSSPTPTPSPSPAPTSTPTPGPTFTPTSTPTGTPTPTPTVTPCPTPPPSVQLDEALRHQANGDYDQAIAAYLAVLDDPATLDQERRARYGLAESYLLNRQTLAAAAAWEDYLARYPDDDGIPQADLMLARALDAANECLEAVPYYQAYLGQEAILADMVYEWIGDCYAGDDQLDEAIAAYRKALSSTADRGVQAGLREKVAGAYLAQEEYDAAVAEYDAILGIAKIETYRATIEYRAGQALAAAGQMDAAYTRFRRNVDSYPQAEYAYLSLIELVNAGVEVDEFQRGLVDTYAGSAHPDAYTAAIRAFDRYLDSKPAAKADEALYRKALAQRAVDQAGEALKTLEMLITGYPQSTWRVRARLEKGATLAVAGNNEAAVQVYRDVAVSFPADALAPEALWRAAKLREGEGARSAAAQLYEDLQAAFPAYKNADQALWQAGLNLYRAGKPEKAVDDWQALLDKYPKSSYRAQTRYWLGKAGAVPKSDGAVGYWDQLVKENVHGYYALRVQQIRGDYSLTATRMVTAAVEPPPWNAAQEEGEILAWLRTWTEVPTDTQLATLPASLTFRLDFRRGQALLAVGLRREAVDAFDGVRAAAWQDPLSLARLAVYFRGLGLNGLASRSASRVVGLWPGESIYQAPPSLQRLAYPLAYADLLSAEAQARGLDPLLLAALVRQESLFEPVAESYAGARGLGQVMPATGNGIARNLKMGDFVLDDLYRPSISIKFASYYLALQLGRFDDQILMGLAAYNGGPGNTLRWQEAAGGDLDLFVEVITASQSRIYLQRVYEQYMMYEALYRSSDGTRQ